MDTYFVSHVEPSGLGEVFMTTQVLKSWVYQKRFFDNDFLASGDSHEGMYMSSQQGLTQETSLLLYRLATPDKYFSLTIFQLDFYVQNVVDGLAGHEDPSLLLGKKQGCGCNG